MAKKTVQLSGWKVQLRIRIQRKKRVRKGRVRGRYEGETAHAIVTAPNGETREYYLGSGARHKQLVDDKPASGEEKRRGAHLELLDVEGGRNGGKNARITDAAARVRETEQYSRSTASDSPRGKTLWEISRGAVGKRPKWR